jgi:hypothetical protein
MGFRTRVCDGIVFGLVLGMVAWQAASADTVVVKQSNLAETGWVVACRQGAQVGTTEGGTKAAEAVAEFAGGYATAPSGAGGLHLYVGSGMQDPLPKAYVGTNRFSGIRLDRITQFKLWVCPRWWDYLGAQPVTVEIAVAVKGNIRLCTFYPWGTAPTGYYGKHTWREVSLLGVGGTWELTNTDEGDNYGNWDWLLNRCAGAAIITPAASDWPVGTLTGAGVNIKIGAGKAAATRHPAWWRESNGCNAYVDMLTIGYRRDDGTEVVTTFDFEPES